MQQHGGWWGMGGWKDLGDGGTGDGDGLYADPSLRFNLRLLPSASLVFQNLPQPGHMGTTTDFVPGQLWGAPLQLARAGCHF